MFLQSALCSDLLIVGAFLQTSKDPDGTIIQYIKPDTDFIPQQIYFYFWGEGKLPSGSDLAQSA